MALRLGREHELPVGQQLAEEPVAEAGAGRFAKGLRMKRPSAPANPPSWHAYLYLLPTFVILGTFVFYPIVDSFFLSRQRVAPFGSQTIDVGFGNYSRLLGSAEYWNNVKVSLLFMLSTVPVGILLAVALALALSVPMRRLSWLHRTLIFAPVIISSAVTGVLFRQLYNPVVGHLNTALAWVGIDGPDWLTSQKWALLAVSIAVVWRQMGFNVIIALAGIQNIDQTLYDAAKVDGASTWQRIRYITLPMLTPTLFFLSIVNVIFSLQAFGEINILTDGGPGQSTTNLVYAVFVDAFVGTSRRGFASAQAFLLALIIVFISVLQFRGLGKKVHYG